jgi:hypothetical protein
MKCSPQQSFASTGTSLPKRIKQSCLYPQTYYACLFVHEPSSYNKTFFNTERHFTDLQCHLTATNLGWHEGYLKINRRHTVYLHNNIGTVHGLSISRQRLPAVQFPHLVQSTANSYIFDEPFLLQSSKHSISNQNYTALYIPFLRWRKTLLWSL